MYLGLRHTVYYQLCITKSVHSFLILTIKHLSRGLHYTMINTWLIAKVFYFHINFNFDEYNNCFFPIAEQLHAMIIVRYIWNLNYAFWLQFIVSSNSIWKIESQKWRKYRILHKKMFSKAHLQIHMWLMYVLLCLWFIISRWHDWHLHKN